MSERSYYDTVAIDTEGNALEDIQVTVVDRASGDPATIYTTITGGSTKPNPFTTGINGLISFSAPPGSYRLDLTDTQLPQRVSDRSLYWDSVSGYDNGIPASKLELTDLTGDIDFSGGAAIVKDGVLTGGNFVDDSIGAAKLNILPLSDVLGAESTLAGVYGNLCSISSLTAGGKYAILATIGVRLPANTFPDPDAPVKGRLLDGLTPFNDPFIRYTTEGYTGKDSYYQGSGLTVRTMVNTSLTLQGYGAFQKASAVTTRLEVYRIA